MFSFFSTATSVCGEGLSKEEVKRREEAAGSKLRSGGLFDGDRRKKRQVGGGEDEQPLPRKAFDPSRIE